MTVEWPQSGGWRSFEAWKRWYLQEYGRVDPPPTQRPSVRLYGAYRVFSAPDGIQTEVEVAEVDPTAVAAAEREVRWRALRFLRRYQGYLTRDTNSVVFLQLNFFEDSPGRSPNVASGDLAAPPSAPRRSLGELVAAALEDLSG